MRTATCFLAGAILAAPHTLNAQGPARAVPGATAEMLQATAELRPAEPAVPLYRTGDADATVMVASGQKHHGEAVALMVAGGAGVILGLIVDEPVVTVAGAVAGGIGLYLYLK